MKNVLLPALLCAASATASPERVTVLFKAGVSDAEVIAFLTDWGSVGVRPVAQTAAGAVVVVLPADLRRADIGRDPLVGQLR